MYIAFLVILLAWLVVMNLLDLLPAKKPKEADVVKMSERKEFVVNMAFIWVPALVVLVLSFIGNISLQDLGFRPISFNHPTWFTAATLIAGGSVFAYYMLRLALSLFSPKFREKQAIAYGDDKDVPRTAKDRKMHTIYVFSTATCEELISRGFTVFLLMAVFPGISVFLVILISSALFGLSHIYQGFSGIVRTGIFGVITVSLFLATDSLIFPMLFHFAADFSYTFILPKEQAV
ncbi:MAG: CPBP family intramembrane metalloprotease [Clostridiales bacterium]|jgi:membrane protease YdiL (CAAX protease family)|nr:CPBP family intramembrane metalloprotease [Clostridiales bacterium]